MATIIDQIEEKFILHAAKPGMSKTELLSARYSRDFTTQVCEALRSGDAVEIQCCANALAGALALLGCTSLDESDLPRLPLMLQTHVERTWPIVKLMRHAVTR